MGGAGEDPAGLLPEIVLLAGTVVTLLVGVSSPRSAQHRARDFAAVTLAAAIIVAVARWADPPRMLYEGSYAVDVATNATRAIAPAASLLILATSGPQVRGSRRETEFYVLMLLGTLGAVTLAGASDLLLLGVTYLLASVPLYGLAGWNRDRLGAEAALKTYLLGALLSIVMLLGITVLTGVGGGDTTYASLVRKLPDAPAGAVAFGVAALLAGLLFKVGGVPAHFWVPDAVEGATVPAAAFLTTVPKVGGLVALYRVMTVLPEDAVNWRLLLAVLASASMTLGNLAAFWQTSPRRLLAYSTVSQVGYLLMAVAVAAPSGPAVSALLIYLAAYSATNVGAFAVVAAVPALPTVSAYRALARSRPGLSVALAVCLLGLVGIPPTAVFVGKLTVFSTTWTGDFGWLVVVAAVNTVASLFYYLRWVAPLFASDGGEPTSVDVTPRLRESATGVDPVMGILSTPRPVGVAVLFAAVGVVLLGLAAGPLLDAASGTLAR